MKKPIKLWKHHAIFEIVHLEAGVLKGQFPKEFSKKVTAPRPCDRSAPPFIVIIVRMVQVLAVATNGYFPLSDFPTMNSLSRDELTG